MEILYLLLIPVPLFLILVLILVRNEWVFHQRLKLNRFENGVHVINQYLSYDEMMFRFWIWNIEKMQKP